MLRTRREILTNSKNVPKQPKPRDEKTEEILSAMDDWDLETLLSWAKAERRRMLGDCSDAEIQECWEEDVNQDLQEFGEDAEPEDE